jgi:general secretion pathway protein A
MYAAYFGLKQEPFSIAPDPRLLFMSDQHREASRAAAASCC